MNWKTLTKQGLWDNNPALVQMLGLCPLLAVSNNLVNGLTLGLATMMVLISSNVSVSAMRHVIPRHVRIPIFVILIATYVTVVERIMQAYAYDLYLTLGIFIPLIVTNCAIIGRAEAFASRNSIGSSMIDGAAHGLGFTLVLSTLGLVRELLGQGTLLSGLGDLVQSEVNLTWQVFEAGQNFLLVLLPPGAFITLGLLIAVKNYCHMSKVKTGQNTKERKQQNTSAI